MTLQELKDVFATKLFGMSLTEAHAKGVCVHCKEPALPKCYSSEGRKEYAISAWCEACWNEEIGKAFREENDCAS